MTAGTPAARAVGSDASPVVTLHVWELPTSRLARAAPLVAAGALPARRHPGTTFAKLLGTGSGETFLPGDATPRRWALLAVHADAATADRFAAAPVVARWRRLATEDATLSLRPLASRGRWSRRAPFPESGAAYDGGPVVAVTRARLRPAQALRFWRATPPVVSALHGSAGLRLAFGVGEAPVGLQGTVSVWDDRDAMRAFAHRSPAHVAAVRATPAERWYAEELFAHFEVVSVNGTIAGIDPGAPSGS